MKFGLIRSTCSGFVVSKYCYPSDDPNRYPDEQDFVYDQDDQDQLRGYVAFTHLRLYYPLL